MERIRIEMPGRAVAVESDVPGLLEDLAFFLGGRADGGDPVDLEVRVTSLGRGDGYQFTTTPPSDLRPPIGIAPRAGIQLGRALRSWFARHSPHYFTLQGAGVSDGRRGLLMIGDAAREGSPLAAGLVRRGAELHGDGIVLLERYTRQLVPFSGRMLVHGDDLARLGLRPDDGRPTGEGQTRIVDPTALGGKSGMGAARVEAVAFPIYSDASPPSIETLSFGEAIASLAPAASAPERFGAAGADFIPGLAVDATCHRVTFGDIHEALDALESLLR